jgi:hypothetical protein
MSGKSALILVIGFSIIVSIVTMNVSRLSISAVGNMSSYANTTASNNLATIGANVALAKFYQDTTWFGSMTQTFNSSTLKGSFTATMADLGGNVARLRSVSSYQPSPSEPIMRDTVEVYFDKSKQNIFSLFAWMTNSENGVDWITKDTVWGRVHSNGRIDVNGKPVFYDKITTSSYFNPKPGKNPNYGIYKNGYETGVAKVEFPNDLNYLVDIAKGMDASGRFGVFYSGDIWVTLNPGTAANNDGKAYVRTSPTGSIVDSVDLSEPMFSGVIMGENRVNLQGTLDGRLTIGSMDDLWLQNDVLYEKNPRVYTNSDDMLGIVAENDIVVADNAANSSNCVIHGSVFSRNGSFRAENHSGRGIDGELHLLGSIVQDVRGPVGTHSGGVITSGFLKRYRYDDRLADRSVRPPHYPGYFVRTYAITNWWESYRVSQFRD